ARAPPEACARERRAGIQGRLLPARRMEDDSLDAVPGSGLAGDRRRPRDRAGLVRRVAAATPPRPQGRADPADHPASGRRRARLGVPALATPRLSQPDPPPPALVERPL